MLTSGHEPVAAAVVTQRQAAPPQLQLLEHKHRGTAAAAAVETQRQAAPPQLQLLEHKYS